MAFTISLCPYCGGEVSAGESGYVICDECGKRVFRSRSNRLAFLAGKPYEEEYSEIVNNAPGNPDNALAAMIEKFTEVEEPDADMFFVRGLIYSLMGEDGKAYNDWRKGAELVKDVRFIDAYITMMCKCTADLIVAKERDFIEFDQMKFIDDLSSYVGTVWEVPCKGVFHITIYKDLKMLLQAGTLAIDDGIYDTVVPPLIKKIVSFGRYTDTNVGIIKECLEDFEYNPETYEDDDCLEMHLYATVANSIEEKTENFTDEHKVRIFRHWNDYNMLNVENRFSDLLNSVRDDSFLQSLRNLTKYQEDEFDLDKAVEDFVSYILLLDEEEGSEDAQMF